MIRKVTHVSLLVHDQQEALRWYVDKLGFEKRADDPFPGEDGRWITIAPMGQPELQIVLQPPDWGTGGDTESRRGLVGKQPGWVLVTDDCRAEYETLRERGVEFTSPPEELPWGISATFVDLYGNTHNLLEPKAFGYATRPGDEGTTT